MQLDDLLLVLEDWSKWMRHDEHGLGYPKKSSVIISGGESSFDAFEIMAHEMDLYLVEVVNAIIDGLEQDLRNAIYARYLNGNKPLYYEMKLQLALEKILSKAQKRFAF
jgi:hypothetical protein